MPTMRNAIAVLKKSCDTCGMKFPMFCGQPVKPVYPNVCFSRKVDAVGNSRRSQAAARAPSRQRFDPGCHTLTWLIVAIPATYPTSCAFGGPDLRDLYVTTAATALTAEERLREPFAGGLFRCRDSLRRCDRRGATGLRTITTR